MSRKPIKRAVWAVQPRAERAKLAQSFSAISRSKSAMELYAIMSNKQESLSSAEARNFLLANLHETKSVIRKFFLEDNNENLYFLLKTSGALEAVLRKGGLEELFLKVC